MSLRSRVGLLSSLVLVVAIAVITVVTVGATDDALTARGDDELATATRILERVAEAQLNRIGRTGEPINYRAFPASDATSILEGFAVLRLADGSTAPLPALFRGDPEPPAVPEEAMARADGRPFDMTGEDGVRYRANAVRVRGSEATLFVAVSTEAWDRTTADLVRTHLVTGAIVLVVFVVLVGLAVWLALRPLGRITEAATRMSLTATPEPLPEAPSGTEVGRLTDALNTMLLATEEANRASERSRRRTEQFAADAAHELRTPVTAIKGYADLYRVGGIEGRARLDDVFGRIGAEAGRLERLVEDLLVLNRLDHGTGSATGHADLASVVEAVRTDSQAIDARYPVEREIDPNRGTTVVALDEHHAAMIVGNLVANVRAHTPPGTRTRVRVVPGAPPGSVLLVVTDDGPGIAPDILPHVLDRFVRGDASRQRSAGTGSGLGLAIVAALADEAGGDIVVEAGDGGGTRVSVALPASGPTAEPSR